MAAGDADKQRVCDVCFLRVDSAPSAAPVWRVVIKGAPCLLSVQGFRISVIAGGAVSRSIHVFSVVAIRISGCRLDFTLDTQDPSFSVVCLEPQQVIDAYVEAMTLDFIDLYRGWCDYFFTPPDATLLQEIIDRTNAGNRALDLTTLPGAQSQHLALDLRPVARALKHNTYFTSLIMHNLHRKDAVAEMVNVLETNRALIALRFSAMQNGSGLERLGPLLQANPASRLSSLTLSDTPLSTEGAR